MEIATDHVVGESEDAGGLVRYHQSGETWKDPNLRYAT